MPVRFQGESEYDTRFRWRPSYRSASFVPEQQQLQSYAGLTSSKLGNVMEPPIQRKKRSVSPSKNENIISFDADVPKDEYMLLGSQSKFASNIQYKPRPNDVRRQGKENGARDSSPPRSPPPAPRQPPPPPKVIVDTGAPKPKSKEKPQAPKVVDQATNTRVNGIKNTQEVETTKKVEEPKFVPKAALKPQAQRKPAAAPKQSSQEPKKRNDTKKGSFNEYAQTNLEKGISHSAQEAQRDYAMKYKAGIAPARMRGPKRVSEYQKQFQWKDGVKPSPLLAAEQIVYKSNPAVPPNRPARMTRNSEYNNAFKEWKAQPVPQDDTPKKRLKRSKSLEAVTPDRRRPAGIQKVTSDEDKRLVSESMNSLKLHFPHGRLKNYGSEYAMNFKAPAKFEYEGGAWKGADPPHIEPKPEEIEQDGSQYNTWYQEVMELRAKAAEYKKRAQGTHFAREHLAQLYAKQADFWDTVSNSDTLSALDLELEGGQRTPQQEKPKKAGAKQNKKKSKQAWSDDRASTISARSSRTVTPRGSVASFVSDATLEDEKAMYTNQDFDDLSDEGRVPTPKLRAVQPVIRHHLDRTTPSTGGAILVSPNKQGSRSTSQMSDDSEAFGMNESPKTLPKTKKSKNRSRKGSMNSGPAARASVSAPAKVPTYGMATRDSHVLIDEEGSVDRPLQTSFVHSPEQNKGARKARQKFPSVAIPDTIQEDGGATFNKTKKANWEVKLDDIPRRNTEDDIMSMSARSIASSCSLASETLERARRNMDEFWGDSSSVVSYQ